MAKGIYQHVRAQWKKRTVVPLMKSRMIGWRKQKTVERVERPTRLDRARAVGYKAKPGFVVVRVKIRKGGRQRRLYGRRGRKPSKSGLVRFTFGKSHQWQAEERAAKRYQNMEVLNSYYVTEDGTTKWFEVILVDPNHPAIQNDPRIKWITNPANRRRVLRGLTSSGRKARGLR